MCGYSFQDKVSWIREVILSMICICLLSALENKCEYIISVVTCFHFHCICYARSSDKNVAFSGVRNSWTLWSWGWPLWNGIVMNVELDNHLQWFHAQPIEDRSVRGSSRGCQILQIHGRAECSDSHAIYMCWDLTALCLRPLQTVMWGILLLLRECWFTYRRL